MQEVSTATKSDKSKRTPAEGPLLPAENSENRIGQWDVLIFVSEVGANAAHQIRSLGVSGHSVELIVVRR